MASAVIMALGPVLKGNSRDGPFPGPMAANPGTPSFVIDRRVNRTGKKSNGTDKLPDPHNLP